MIRDSEPKKIYGVNWHPENDDETVGAYADPLEEEYSLELTGAGAQELAQDLQRAIEAKIRYSIQGNVPPHVNFTCGEGFKVTYQREPTIKGSIAYSILEELPTELGTVDEVLLTLTNVQDGNFAYAVPGLGDTEAHFEVELESGTYYLHIWRVDDLSLHKIDEVVKSFMFHSVAGLPQTMRDQRDGRVTEVLPEGIRGFAQNILRKLTDTFRGRK